MSIFSPNFSESEFTVTSDVIPKQAQYDNFKNANKVALWHGNDWQVDQVGNQVDKGEYFNSTFLLPGRAALKSEVSKRPENSFFLYIQV